jgi:hypothetical protein
MKKTYDKIVREHTGKVRLVEGNNVRVSIWDEKEGEIVGDMVISQFASFPKRETIEPGYVFKYVVYRDKPRGKLKGRAEYVPRRKLTKTEIEEIEEEVRSSLEGIDLDVL